MDLSPRPLKEDRYGYGIECLKEIHADQIGLSDFSISLRYSRNEEKNHPHFDQKRRNEVEPLAWRNPTVLVASIVVWGAFITPTYKG